MYILENSTLFPGLENRFHNPLLSILRGNPEIKSVKNTTLCLLHQAWAMCQECKGGDGTKNLRNTNLNFLFTK